MVLEVWLIILLITFVSCSCFFTNQAFFLMSVFVENKASIEFSYSFPGNITGTDELINVEVNMFFVCCV